MYQEPHTESNKGECESFKPVWLFFTIVLLTHCMVQRFFFFFSFSFFYRYSSYWGYCCSCWLWGYCDYPTSFAGGFSRFGFDFSTVLLSFSLKMISVFSEPPYLTKSMIWFIWSELKSQCFSTSFWSPIWRARISISKLTGPCAWSSNQGLFMSSCLLPY